MGIALLKKINQKMPDGFKTMASPLIRRQLTGNKMFLDQYALCEQYKAASEDERLAYQADELGQLVAFAYANVPYYRWLFDEAGLDPKSIEEASDLKALPLLTKKDLKQSFDNLQAVCVEDWYEATTGGSSGEPTRVNLERASIYREKAFIYSFWKNFGYDWEHDKIATFRGVEFGGKLSKPNPLYNEILLNPFILNEENVADFARAIERFGAAYLHGYPSAIQNFCRLLKKTGTKLNARIQAVFFISETVNESQVRTVQEILGCPCRAFYGHSERAVFAEQHTDDVTYTFNPLYGVTQIEEHDSGNIVCTGFLNRRMPLIRYAVDDWAEQAGGEVSLEGHRDAAYLEGKGGERITQTALNFHDGTFDAVDGYQLVQEEAGTATCRIAADRTLEEKELARISAALRGKTGDAIEWRVVQEDFEKTSRGKTPSVIRKRIPELRGGGLRDYWSSRRRIPCWQVGRAHDVERTQLPWRLVRGHGSRAGRIPVRSERTRKGHLPSAGGAFLVDAVACEHAREARAVLLRCYCMERRADGTLRADLARKAQARRPSYGRAA